MNLRIEEGEFFTLLGPSGCGKSTTLRMIAGFEEPDSGQILFNDRDVTYAPANKRDVGLVFQNYALFPHMSVAKNVGFGLAVRKIRGAAAGERIREALAQVHLTEQASARVDELSGGQQQRVALARALVFRPQLLLLDEPMSNLDAKLRLETRGALRKLHAETGITSIYVTHDQAEALAMSTRVAVMNTAEVHQVGTPAEVYERPNTRFVATFLGRNNIFDGVVTAVDGDVVRVRLANATTIQGSTSRTSPGLLLVAGSTVGATIRAEAIGIASENDSQNVVNGTVTDVEYVGATLSCELETPIGPLLLDLTGAGIRPTRGDRLSVLLPAASVYFVPAEPTP
jgi:iron(III) transport system ATP-binding protein